MSKMIIDEFGNKIWRNEKGQLHRGDGPAIEWNDGNKEWYQHGNLHREGGPAVESPNNHKIWYQEGLLHRSEGPAVEYVVGYKEYWYGGERYIEIRDDREWSRVVRLLVIK